MTDYTRIRNTIMSNPRGIMDSCLSMGLQNRVISNVKLYFYIYSVHDLVEIEYKNDIVCVYDFVHTENRASVIRDKLEFYAGYFKSAGLENKRFLFDISLKMPVNYEDFAEMATIPYIQKKEFAFILDKKSGYICESDVVQVFVSTEKTDEVDKCVLATMNQLINVKNPKRFNLPGCMSSMLVCGLLSGLNSKKIEEQIDLIDEDSKFVNTIKQLNFNSANINNSLSKLKVDKLKRILEKSQPDIINGDIIKKEISNGEVNLTDIIIVGLDKFIKVLDTTKDVIRVCIDCEHQTIRSAYIIRGTIFITPVTFMSINYFKELLDTDNVEYIIN